MCDDHHQATDLKDPIQNELRLARQAVGRGELLVARSHFLRAILDDSGDAARLEYAAFLADSGESANAIAEYARLLETAEQAGKYGDLREIAWRMAGVYRAWGEEAQSRYFMEYAVLLEGEMLVYHQLGRELRGGARGVAEGLAGLEEEIGKELLKVLAEGISAREAVLWLVCGISEWLRGESARSLASLRTGLSVARASDRGLLGDFFLWIGRVSYHWGEPQLGELALRRAGAWGLAEGRERCELELALRTSAKSEA